jgi:hypothetical protein
VRFFVRRFTRLIRLLKAVLDEPLPALKRRN